MGLFLMSKEPLYRPLRGSEVPLYGSSDPSVSRPGLTGHDMCRVAGTRARKGGYEVEVESIWKILARAAATGHSN